MIEELAFIWKEEVKRKTLPKLTVIGRKATLESVPTVAEIVFGACYMPPEKVCSDSIKVDHAMRLEKLLGENLVFCLISSGVHGIKVCSAP